MGDVVSQIRAALALSDPELDTSAGTTTRKIIDAVSESIAESYLDQHMLAYTYDIDSKSGADLDTFCQTVGGIARLAAKRATGSVTFSRSGASVATNTVFVPAATQVVSSTYPNVVVSTISSAVMLPGESSVTVPVQAVVGGPQGNVAPNTLIRLGSQLDGVTSVSNLNALSGGTSQETDAELRSRWKSTVFRSLAGTEQMYQGVALNHDDVTAARVIGSSVVQLEQIQPFIATSGPLSGKLCATSAGRGVSYAYPQGILVGGDIANRVLLVEGLDYTVNFTAVTANGNPPTIVFNDTLAKYDTGQVDSSGAPIMANVNGGILDLQYYYVPVDSRNDPTGTRFAEAPTTSKVDVYVAGEKPTAAVQTLPFDSSLKFDSVAGSSMNIANFNRQDMTRPVSGNIFIPLSFGPILTLPDSLSIGGKTYGRDGVTGTFTHSNAYRAVYDSTPRGGTATSRFGIEFNVSGLTLPANRTVFTVGLNGGYTYNAVVREVQQDIDRWRLAGVDAQAHAAQKMQMRFSLAIMYDPDVTRGMVDPHIQDALSDLLKARSMGGVIQVSDVVQAVHNIPGVDNVRMLAPSDYSGWTYATANNYKTGIQFMYGGSVVRSYINSDDYSLQDVTLTMGQYATFHSAHIVVKAQNTFRAS